MDQFAAESDEVGDGFLAGEFDEAVFLALVGEDHADLPVLGAPLVELAEEGLAAGLFEDEVAGFEAAERAAEAGGGKVLFAFAVFHTAENPDVAVRLFEADADVALSHVIANRGIEFGLGEEELGLFQLADGGLGIDVELAEGIDYGVEELDPQRPAALPGEDIEDAAAHRELAAALNGDDAIVAVRRKLGC